MLECLSQQASFTITVTRFAQMARYLVLNDLPAKTSLDDIGLEWPFYKCLAELDPKIYVFMVLLSRILSLSSS